MKLKISFIFVFVFFVGSQVNAQLKHYLSLNTVVYYDYFNQEKDRAYLRWPRFGFFVPAYPNFSYKVERKQFGIELFYNDNGIGYYGRGDNQERFERYGAIRQITSFNIGLTCQYTFLCKRFMEVSSMVGLVRTKYDAWIIDRVVKNGWNEPYFLDGIEKRIGPLLGVNINIPIWKGIYANTNTRYMIFPGAQYNKQNLVFDIGLGYMYQNKAKKKKK